VALTVAVAAVAITGIINLQRYIFVPKSFRPGGRIFYLNFILVGASSKNLTLTFSSTAQFGLLISKHFRLADTNSPIPAFRNKHDNKA
jgi:hypothetical protein